MTQPDASSRASVDNQPRRADDRRMEDRLHRIEQDLAAVRTDVAGLRTESATKADLGVVREDLATVKTRLINLETRSATKQDVAELRGLVLEQSARLGAQTALAKAEMLAMMNAQTWKFVTWMSATMGMMTAAVYFIARNVH